MSGGRQSDQHAEHQDASRAPRSANGTGSERPSQTRTRIDYECPFCGGAADATYRLLRLGDEDWLIGCRKRGCDGYGDEPPLIAEAIDLPPGATKAQMAARLAERNPPRTRSKPERLPGPEQVGWWQEALRAEPRRYLVEDRGISEAVIRHMRIGWDGRKGRLVFPMFKDGEVVNAKWCKIGGKLRSWPREAIVSHPLYPDPGLAQGSGWILLVAGEKDALALVSRGVPATSVTLGAGNWREEWTADLAGLEVAVCFDIGEEEQARERVAALRAAGITARRFNLRDVGLSEHNADPWDYLRAGGDPARLRPRRVVRRGGRR